VSSVEGSERQQRRSVRQSEQLAESHGREHLRRDDCCSLLREARQERSA
jgi:hypothetical protein